MLLFGGLAVRCSSISEAQHVTCFLITLLNILPLATNSLLGISFFVY